METIPFKEYAKESKVGDVILTDIYRRVAHPVKVMVMGINGMTIATKWIDPAQIQEAKHYYSVGCIMGEVGTTITENEATVTLLERDGKAIVAPEKKKKEYRTMSVQIEKSQGNIQIAIHLPQEVEDYYKHLAKGKKKQSSVWYYANNQPANFYLLSDDVSKSEQEVDREVFSDYGGPLLKGSHINTAILRTIGGAEGITLKCGAFNVATNLDIDYYAKRLGVFLKNLWERSISTQKVSAKITYEI